MPEVHGIEPVLHYLQYRPVTELAGKVIDPSLVIAWLRLAADHHPETGFSIVDSLRLEDFIMRNARKP